LTFDDYKKNTKPVHDTIVEVIISQGGESISALILPPDQIWPSFMDMTKQEGRCGQRVLFKRTSALFLNILTKAVDVLSATKSMRMAG
jgi:hypothetical protein